MKKLTNKKGFTLMEMLIVVAIIAILVAILIPTIGSSLTSAKEAADVANIRAAYAQYQTAKIQGDTTVSVPTITGNTITVTSAFGNFTADINYTAKFSMTAATPTSPAIIQYGAVKLNGGKTYTWELVD